MAVSLDSGVFFAGVLMIRDLVFGVYVRVLDFLEIPILRIEGLP